MSDLKLFSVVPDSTKEEALNPTSNLIGQAFRGIAHKVLDPLVRYNIVKDAEMEDFANKIRNKTDQVPVENRDASKLGLAYKAVEDSTYQLNVDELREMFSNLITATVDNRKNNLVRPSFSSILKDLSPTDASLFRVIYQEEILPIGSIRVHNSRTLQGVTIKENVILLKDTTIENQSSLNVLQRFGLIDIYPDANLIAQHYEDRYNHYQESIDFKKYEPELPFDSNDGLILDSVILKKGNIKLSSLGQEFGSVIIS